MTEIVGGLLGGGGGGKGMLPPPPFSYYYADEAGTVLLMYTFRLIILKCSPHTLIINESSLLVTTTFDLQYSE